MHSLLQEPQDEALDFIRTKPAALGCSEDKVFVMELLKEKKTKQQTTR